MGKRQPDRQSAAGVAPLVLPQALKSDVADALGWYVYALVDPNSDEVFYIGKGKGSRFLSHEKEAVQQSGSSAKHDRIRAILATGTRPRVDILRHDLPDEYTALLIESAIIDALSPRLTNAVRGHNAERAPLDELKVRYASPELPLDTPPAVMVRISRWKDQREEIEPGYFRDGNGWRQGMTVTELADATRAWWKVSPVSVEGRCARHAVAVHDGITRAVFRIGEWTQREDGRRAFAAEPVVSGEIHDAYVGPLGKRLPAVRGSQNPITYWPA